MRLLATVLLVAIALQGVLAVTSRASQNKLMIEKINKSMEKSHLGRALKNMITLASKLGYNYDDLFDAIDALKASLLSGKQNEDDLYSNQSSLHESAVTLIDSDISTYQGQIVDGEATLADLRSQLSDLDAQLAYDQAALAQAQSDVADANNSLVVLDNNYSEEVADFQDAQNIIAQAVTALQDAQANYDSASLGDYSFAQMKSNFVIFAEKITKATSGLKARHQLFIKPVIQAMKMVQTSSNQSSIDNVIQSLRELQAYFNESAAAAVAIYQSSRDNLTSRISTLNDSIDNYANTLIPDLENRISNVEQNISTTQDALATAVQNLANSQDALVAENDAFDATTQRHNALLDRINQEYGLVVQAERILSDVVSAQSQDNVSGSD